MDIIPKIPSIYDEPFSDSSQIPTFLVSQLARQNVKVALSGDGGDELFCGYNRYQLINKRSKILSSFPLFFRKLLSNRIKSISQNKWNQIFKMIPGVNKYANFAYKMHKGANAIEAKNLESLYYVLCSDWQNPTDVVIDSKETKKQFNFLDYNLKQLRGYQKMMAIDAITYLPNDILVKIDRAAMSSSLETRTPFLNHKLIEYVWKIPHSLKLRNGDGKWILKQILNQYVPKNLVDRPKMGFGIPLASWLRGPLRDWVENLINEKKLLKAGFLNPKLVRQKWELHLSNKKNTHYELWNVLMFLAWMEDNNQIN
jgi:asparagine synthase (glutamine-hydrolysing)